jgi:photosystem II stability/assembly factor-like uncharacterized protein
MLSYRLFVHLLVLLAVVAPTFPSFNSFGATPVARPKAPPAPDTLEAFQAVTPSAGWVLLDDRLFWTADLGGRWTDITPPGMGGALVRAVTFADAQHGWGVAVEDDPAGDPRYTLLTTADGGAAWHAQPLDLFAPGETAAHAAEIHVQFIDTLTGWLVVEEATGSAFSLGTLFGTRDGGETWTRRALPLGAPVRFTSARDGVLAPAAPAGVHFVTADGGLTWTRVAGDPPTVLADAAARGLSGLSLAAPAAGGAPTAGWGRSTAGECDAHGCRVETRLLATTDGGETWAALPLPGGARALSARVAAPADRTAAEVVAGYTLTVDAQGFDGCFGVATAPLWQMQAWWESSPYRARNLYLGGAAGTNCGTLTHDYVAQLAQQGWLFIPTWVGPQVPCSSRARKMSLDPATAYQQGIVEAHLARRRAQALGLTLPDGTGAVLYYDVEAYSGTPAAIDACRAAARAFIDGWTVTLHQHGLYAGVYGSTCSSRVSDFAGLPHVPDFVWLASWSQPYAYDPNASVWNLPCLDNSLWTQQQRLRQYNGDHNETWGGVTLNIDSDVLAGAVTTAAGNCGAGPGQVALFVHPHFGGECVVKSAGVYSLPATLDLPNDAISAVRVGPGARLRLCEHAGFAGRCAEVSADVPHLGALPLGDDVVSSALVETTTLTLTHRLYLPRVIQTAGPVTMVSNGDFESGPAAWGQASALGRPLIAASASITITPNPVRAGGWAAWLGGANGETAALSQAVVVPAGAPHLAWWQLVVSQEGACHYDTFAVWVNGSVVDAWGVCAAGEAPGWTRRSVDLRAFAGQAIEVRLALVTDGSLISSVLIDDVTFEAGP